MTDHTLEQAQNLKNRILRLEAMQKLSGKNLLTKGHGKVLMDTIEASDDEICQSILSVVKEEINFQLSAAESEFEALT